MPSSTSSSERRVALRTALAGVALFAGAMGVIRGCTEATRLYALDPFGVVRLDEAHAALSELAAAPGRKALVFGSSLIHFGFSPERFDRALAAAGHELESYNLGFGGLNPQLQVVLARRIREEFEAAGSRVDLILVEFNPFQATRARASANARSVDGKIAVLSTPRSLLAEARVDPERAARRFTIKYLRAGLAAEAVTAALEMGVGSALDGGTPEKEVDADFQSVLDERKALALEVYARYGEEIRGNSVGGWALDFRGGIMPIAPALSDETMDLLARLMRNLAHPRSLEGDREDRLRCCDIVKLHFDDALVDHFIALVGELASISNRIEVILMPKNQAWIVNPPEARVRQRAVLERIQRETGVSIRDYQYDPGIVPSDYMDTTHLSPHQGQVRFTDILAADWASRL